MHAENIFLQKPFLLCDPSSRSWVLSELRLFCAAYSVGGVSETSMQHRFYSSISGLCIIQSVPWGLLFDDYNKKKDLFLLFFVKVLSLLHVTQLQGFKGPFTPNGHFKHTIFMTTEL